MSRAETDEFLYESATSSASASGGSVSTGIYHYPRQWVEERRTAPLTIPFAAIEKSRAVRRTPRKSLIVVLPEGHVVASEAVTSRMLSTDSDERVDVIVACAGRPLNLASLQRDVRDLQVLVAPAGTSTEDLRELAIGQAPGDIVTLLCGVPIET